MTDLPKSLRSTLRPSVADGGGAQLIDCVQTSKSEPIVNFRPWYQQLLLHPFSFMWDLFTLAYGRSRFTNPTRRFEERLADPQLELDVTRGTLNGIPFGASLDRLTGFGVAEDALGDEGEFSLEYSSLGFSASFEKQGLISFEFDFDSLGCEHPTEFIPCKSVMIKTGAVPTVTVGYSSCSDDLRRMFGNPDRVERAEYKFGVERVLFYHLPACRLVASFDDRSGRLIHLELNPPSVATDAGRAAAGSE